MVMQALHPRKSTPGSESVVLTPLHGAREAVETWGDMSMSEWEAASRDASQVSDLRSAMSTIDRSTFEQLSEQAEDPLRAFTQTLTWCMDTSVRWHRTTQEASEKILWSAIA